MEHNYQRDICVIGAGRIGLPWAAVQASHGRDVVCIDIDEDLVATINNGETPFHEPGLAPLLSGVIKSGRLTATTDQSAVTEARVVTSTLNAPNGGSDRYGDIIEAYASHLEPDQTFINRTTLPIPVVSDIHTLIAQAMGVQTDTGHYVTFPERLAEGQAIAEIDALPKLVGTHQRDSHEIIEWLTAESSGTAHYTDHETAMFVKLIDNAYRDARFAIANHFATIAEELGLDAHEAIALANSEYPRNDIPRPGTVGGTCLTKDPYFLTERWVTNLPVDLFAASRTVNETLEDRIVERILKHDPAVVTVLGTAFKKDSADETASPAENICEALAETGVTVDRYDPFQHETTTLSDVIPGADIVLVAVNHTAFIEQKDRIRELANGVIIDIWGLFDPASDVERVGSAFPTRCDADHDEPTYVPSSDR